MEIALRANCGVKRSQSYCNRINFTRIQRAVFLTVWNLSECTVTHPSSPPAEDENESKRQWKFIRELLSVIERAPPRISPERQEPYVVA